MVCKQTILATFLGVVFDNQWLEIDEIPIINKIDENNQTTVRYFYDSYDAFVDIIKLRKLEGKLKY